MSAWTGLRNYLFNPLLRKELRQRMRSGRTAAALFLYLLVIGLVAFVFMYVNVQGQTLLLQPARTAELFAFLSYLQLAMISFVTPGIAAGVISGERERQTLSVLLTTPLSPGSVIFAKWLTSISFLTLLIIMTLPLYSIVFLFGGVVPLQVFAVFGMQFLTLGATASVSIFWSTMLRRSGWSTVFSYATVGVVFVGFGVAGYLFDTLAAHAPDVPVWTDLGSLSYVLNPIFMQASLETSFGLFSATSANPMFSMVAQVVETHALASVRAWVLFVGMYVLGSTFLLFLCGMRLRPGTFSALRRRAVRWMSR